MNHHSSMCSAMVLWWPLSIDGWNKRGAKTLCIATDELQPELHTYKLTRVLAKTQHRDRVACFSSSTWKLWIKDRNRKLWLQETAWERRKWREWRERERQSLSDTLHWLYWSVIMVSPSCCFFFHLWKLAENSHRSSSHGDTWLTGS